MRPPPPPARAAASSGLPAGLDARTLEIETPEHVALQLPLADLGSRFAALLLDLLLVVLLLVAGPLVLLIFTGFAGLDVAESLIVLWSFAVVWGYFFAYEAFRDGQTPGKRRLGLRVVMAGGFPLTVEAAAIRNLIRPIDLLGAGLLGGFVMLVTRRHQRLGDLAAGSVVVRELGSTFPALPPEDSSARGAPLLADAAFAALEHYQERRDELPEAARARLRATLVERLPAATRPRALASGIDVPGGSGVAPAAFASLRRARAGAAEHARQAAAGADVDAFLARLHAEEDSRRRAAALSGRLGTASAARLLGAKRERWLAFQRQVAGLGRRGLRRLDGEEVSAFAARYREVAADLARARTYGASPHTRWALERVVAAAHGSFHRPVRRGARRAWGFLAAGFPRLVRRHWRPIALSALLLYGPTALTYAWLRVHPEDEARLAPAEMIMRAEEAGDRRAAGKGYIDIPLSAGAVVSSRLITNNVQVGFLAFAGGIVAGTFTALLLVFNGLHLGSALALFANRDALDVIGTFVMPHGVLELTAIVIAGGAGLLLGSAWLLPGRQTRLAALADRGLAALGLVAGMAVLLVVAGLIEAYVSPSDLPAPAKLAFAAFTALLLAGYLLGAGRGEPDAPAPGEPP